MAEQFCKSIEGCILGWKMKEAKFTTLVVTGCKKLYIKKTHPLRGGFH
jgi:hypothetical protein